MHLEPSVSTNHIRLVFRIVQPTSYTIKKNYCLSLYQFLFFCCCLFLLSVFFLFLFFFFFFLCWLWYTSRFRVSRDDLPIQLQNTETCSYPLLNTLLVWFQLKEKGKKRKKGKGGNGKKLTWQHDDIKRGKKYIWGTGGRKKERIGKEFQNDHDNNRQRRRETEEEEKRNLQVCVLNLLEYFLVRKLETIRECTLARRRNT